MQNGIEISLNSCYKYNKIINYLCLVKRFAQIFLLVSVGFFLMPNQSYAHNSKSTENYCRECQKNQDCSNSDNACCLEHHSNKNQKNGCEGNCNHSGCHCPTCNVPLLNNGRTQKHYVLKKTNKYHLFDFVLSSGFHSVWIPPKIS